MSRHKKECPLCTRTPATELWQNAHLRVIDAQDPDFPGLTRVVWHDHVSEMSDLDAPQRAHIMEAVWLVESALRNELMPLKINVAALGNYVPHLHWHVIPRWPLDSRYPDAIWAAPHKRSPEQLLAWNMFREQQQELIPAYHASLREALNTLARLPV